MSENPLASTNPPIGVLIIEQEAQIRSLLKMTLEPLGFSLVLASSKQEGMDLLHKHRNELRIVLLAGSLLGPSAEQTLTALRTLHSQIVILVMTGDIETHNPEQLAQWGVAQVLKKPFPLAELIHILRWAAQPRDDLTPDPSSSSSRPKESVSRPD